MIRHVGNTTPRLTFLTRSLSSMSYQQHRPVHIIGAGLAGLVLGRCLKVAGREAVLYQRGSPSPRFAYGITLQPWAYEPLSKVLGLDADGFRRAFAVDATLGGSGNDPTWASNACRVSRWKLEETLRQGLDIRWDHQLEHVESNAEGLKLHFQGKDAVTVNSVVDASGAHSRVRQSLLRDATPKVLPYVVSNGKRKYPMRGYRSTLAPYFQDVCKLEQCLGTGVRLDISIADVKDDTVSISYTYSRASRSEDELYRPARALSDSEDIPETFYDELQGLRQLSEPFASIFQADAVKQDRVLHWLMRSVSLEPAQLETLAQQRAVLIGDAAHAQPILGGQGANAAIRDAVQLASWLDEHDIADIGAFYDRHRNDWIHGVDHSERTLAEMHQPSSISTGPSL